MDTQRDEDSGRPVVVWDLPTRVFHGLLIAFVLTTWITGGEKGILFTIHTLNGYALIASLLFRVVWGFAGSRHSRFSDFVRPWRDVRAHALALLRLRPPPSVGHNPLGGWMVLTLLGTLALIAATGLFAAKGATGIAGPLADLLPRATARAIGDVHETLFDGLMVLVVLHTLGVLAEMLLTGDNLIRAMITGRKELTASEARHEGKLVSPLWAVLVVVVSSAAVWLAFG